MGLRYQKRVQIGGGVGLNLSKSGVSSSYRSKYGSISSRGFSIRTGIPGLTFRSSFSKSKKGSDGLIQLFILLMLGAFILTAIAVWNILLLIKWVLIESYKLTLRILRNHKIHREIKSNSDSKSVSFVSLTKEDIPSEYHKSKIVIDDIFINKGDSINRGDILASILIDDKSATLKSSDPGKVTFYKTPGERIKLNDYLYKIELGKVDS